MDAHLFPTPELEADTLQERPYQAEALEAARSKFRRGVKRTLIVHATGVGKTTVGAKAIRKTIEKGGRGLFLAHRSELLAGALNTLERVGVLAGFEKAESKGRGIFPPGAVVASVATMKGARLEDWPRDYFSLIVADEAHHFLADSFRGVLDHFDSARVLGLTATPDRADGRKLVKLFGEPAHEFDIIQAWKAPPPGPYLCRLLYVQREVDVDLRDLALRKKDYSAEELQAKIAPLVVKLAANILDAAGDRPTLVFAPTIASATAFGSAFSSMGARAAAVWGEDPQRSRKIEASRTGEVQFLCCCPGLMGEGVDLPWIACIGLCCPTRSRALYIQMIGRSLRPAKPNALLVDFNYLTLSHDLRRPADLFLDDGEPLTKGANEAFSGGGRKPVDVLDVVEDVEDKFRRAAIKRALLDVEATKGGKLYKNEFRYDPLGAPPPDAPTRAPMMARHDSPSEPMVRFLERRGHKGAAGYSRRYAGKLIGLFKAAEAQGIKAGGAA